MIKISIALITSQLLIFQELGYHIKDDIKSVLAGDERIDNFWFEIEPELFQLFDGFEDWAEILLLFMSLVLEMREEKQEFIRRRQNGGTHWRVRKPKLTKLPRRERRAGIGTHPVGTPDSITDTSMDGFVFPEEYHGHLPIGYQSYWYGEIKTELLGLIFDWRRSRGLPKREKIIEDAFSKIYHKL